MLIRSPEGKKPMIFMSLARPGFIGGQEHNTPTTPNSVRSFTSLIKSTDLLPQLKLFRRVENMKR